MLTHKGLSCEPVATLNKISNRRFEQFLVLLFLSFPPIGGMVVLYHGLQNPSVFWKTVGWVAYIFLVWGAHIKFVRPTFRRYPWMVKWTELTERLAHVRKKHPKQASSILTTRLLRVGYRIAFALIIAPGFVSLYQMHGHHFGWFMAGWWICGFGITVGYHRVGTHPSFKTNNFVRGILLVMGSCAMQGPAGEWTKKHSKHHAFGETSADVHSPYVFEESKRGIFKEQVVAFLHSFAMWAFREPSLVKPRKLTIDQWRAQLLANPPDPKTFRYRDEDEAHWLVKNAAGEVIVTTETLINKRWARLVETIIKIEEDKVVKVVSHPLIYLAIVMVSVFGLTFVGISAWESLGRLMFLNWVTFGVNSVCHIWGEQPFVTPDNSRNNAIIEVLALGEGGHNSHHKSELWAQHGVFAWQLDPASYVIKTLRFFGLARDLNLPHKNVILRAWREWRQREPNMQGYDTPSALALKIPKMGFDSEEKEAVTV